MLFEFISTIDINNINWRSQLNFLATEIKKRLFSHIIKWFIFLRLVCIYNLFIIVWQSRTWAKGREVLCILSMRTAANIPVMSRAPYAQSPRHHVCPQRSSPIFSRSRAISCLANRHLSVIRFTLT